MQQIGADRFFLVHQKYAVAALVAFAGGGDQCDPFFHRFAFVAGQVQTALLDHTVKSGKAVIPLAGDLDLVGGDGGTVHLQSIAGEPGLDVLCVLYLSGYAGPCGDGAPADVPPQQGAAYHQCAAHSAQTQCF